MTKKTEEAPKKKTIEAALKSGEFIELDGYILRKAGIMTRLAMPRSEYDVLHLGKLFGTKETPKRKKFLAAIAWLIHRCRVNKVNPNAVVALDAPGFPPLAMAVVPFNETDLTSVVVIGIRRTP